jgi:hypothetical protein
LYSYTVINSDGRLMGRQRYVVLFILLDLRHGLGRVGTLGGGDTGTLEDARANFFGRAREFVAPVAAEISGRIDLGRHRSGHHRCLLHRVHGLATGQHNPFHQREVFGGVAMHIDHQHQVITLLDRILGPALSHQPGNGMAFEGPLLGLARSGHDIAFKKHVRIGPAHLGDGGLHLHCVVQVEHGTRVVCVCSGAGKRKGQAQGQHPDKDFHEGLRRL